MRQLIPWPFSNIFNRTRSIQSLPNILYTLSRLTFIVICWISLSFQQCSMPAEPDILVPISTTSAWSIISAGDYDLAGNFFGCGEYDPTAYPKWFGMVALWDPQMNMLWTRAVGMNGGHVMFYQCSIQPSGANAVATGIDQQSLVRIYLFNMATGALTNIYQVGWQGSNYAQPYAWIDDSNSIFFAFQLSYGSSGDVYFDYRPSPIAFDNRCCDVNGHSYDAYDPYMISGYRINKMVHNPRSNSIMVYMEVYEVINYQNSRIIAWNKATMTEHHAFNLKSDFCASTRMYYVDMDSMGLGSSEIVVGLYSDACSSNQKAYLYEYDPNGGIIREQHWETFNIESYLYKIQYVNDPFEALIMFKDIGNGYNMYFLTITPETGVPSLRAYEWGTVTPGSSMTVAGFRALSLSTYHVFGHLYSFENFITVGHWAAFVTGNPEYTNYFCESLPYETQDFAEYTNGDYHILEIPSALVTTGQEYQVTWAWTILPDSSIVDQMVRPKENVCQADRTGLFRQLYPNPASTTLVYHLSGNPLVIPYNEFTLSTWGATNQCTSETLLQQFEWQSDYGFSATDEDLTLKTMTLFTNIPSEMGTYTFTATGFLPQYTTKAYYSITIDIQDRNYPPTLTSAITPNPVHLNQDISTTTLALPTFVDIENDLISVINIIDTVTNTAPSAVALYDSTLNQFTFIPGTTLFGGYEVCFDLADPFGQNNYCFEIYINRKPVWASAATAQTVIVGHTTTYTLPTYSDPDVDTVAFSSTYASAAAFTTLATTTYTFAPTIPSQIGTHAINLMLDDGLIQVSSTFILTVIANSFPTFTTTPLPTQTVQVGFSLVFTLPPCTDADGDTITITTVQSGMATLPAFVTFSGTAYTIQPTLSSQVDQYIINVILNDGIDNVMNQFTLNVNANAPPTFGTIMTPQSVSVGVTSSYSFPAITDPENQPMTQTFVQQGTSTLPGFITYTGSAFNYNPTVAFIGSYVILMTLSDGVNSVTTTFTVNVVANQNPAFTGGLVAQTVAVGWSTPYSPVCVDPEAQTVTVAPRYAGNTTLPPFITFAAPSTFTIAPTLTSQMGTVTLDVTCSDGINTPSYPLSIIISANGAPVFASAIGSLIVAVGFTSTLTLPAKSDPETNSITQTITYLGSSTLPPFVTYFSNVFTASPTLASQIGTFTIQVKLDDWYNQPVYPFDIIVTANQPPFFSTSLVSQPAIPGFTKTYTLPTFTDPESQPVIVTAVQQGQATLPTFVTFSSNTFTMSPTLNSQAGDYIIAVSLNDGSNVVIVPFTITVYENQPPAFGTALADQIVAVGLTKTYTLPLITDLEGPSVTLLCRIVGTAVQNAFISLSGTTLSFSPTLQSQVGFYILECILSDGFQSVTYPLFLIVIPNQPPSFTTILISQTAIPGFTKTYTLPACTDPEAKPITVTAVMSGLTTLPTFVTFASNTFTMTPTLNSQAGVYIIEVSLDDGINVVTVPFTITVTANQPPAFASALVSQSVAVAGIKIYTLPVMTDPEGAPMTLTCRIVGTTALNAFISLAGSTFTFNPTLTSQVGTYNLECILRDGFQSITYPFTLTVAVNQPPAFSSAFIPQTVSVGASLVYTLPSSSDPEGQPMTVSAKLNPGGLPLPSIFTFTGSEFTIAPTSTSDVNLYLIDFTVSDGFQNVVQQLLVTVTASSNSPPYLTDALVDQTIEVNSSPLSYTLPAFADPDGDIVTATSYKFMSSSLPSFVTFSTNRFIFRPTLASQAGPYQIQVALSDGKLTTVYSFSLLVTLPPPPPPPPAPPATTTTPSTTTPPASTTPPATTTPSTSSSGTATPPASVPPSATPPPPPPPPPPVGEDGLPLSDVPPPDDEDTATDTSSGDGTGTTATDDPSSATLSDSPTSQTTSNSSSNSSSANGGSDSTSDSGSSSTSSGGIYSPTVKKKSTSKSYIDRKSGLVVRISTKIPKIDIQAKIKEITMKGVATVLFSDEMVIPPNFTAFNDRFFKIWVTSAEEIMPDQNKSLDSWQIVAFRETEMDIQLNFTDPMSLSQSLKKDILSIRFLANAYFMRQADNETIKYKYQIDGLIPQQIVMTSAVRSLEAAGQLASSGMNYILYGNLGAQVFMSVSMQLLWGMVNTLQLIIHMNMLSVLMPANVQLFFSLIVNIVNFKIIPTDTVISTIFGFKQEFKSKVSPEFQQTGYGTTNLLKNLGLLFLAVLGVIGLVALVYALRLASKRFPLMGKIQQAISRKLFFNSIMRGLLEAYLKFGISTWISVKALQIDDREGIINAWMTILLVGFLLGFPVFIYLLLKKNTYRLQSEDFKGRFESLYLNVDTGVKHSIMTVSLFVFRRLIYSINIVLFSGSTCTQLFVQFFCCLLMLLFFTGVKPLSEPFLNRMEIFNEMTLLICSYFLFAFTDYVGDANTRFMMGWAFIGLAALNITVNWMALLFKVGTAIRQVVRGMIHKWKLKKLQAKKAAAEDFSKIGNAEKVETQDKSSKTPQKKKKHIKKQSINLRTRAISDNQVVEFQETTEFPNMATSQSPTKSPQPQPRLMFQEPSTPQVMNLEQTDSNLIKKTEGEVLSPPPVNQKELIHKKKKKKASKKPEPPHEFMSKVALAISHGMSLKPKGMPTEHLQIQDIYNDEELASPGPKAQQQQLQQPQSKVDALMKQNILFRQNFSQKFINRPM